VVRAVISTYKGPLWSCLCTNRRRSKVIRKHTTTMSMLNAQPRVAKQRVNSLDLVQHVDAHRQSISFQSTERYDVRIDVGAVTHGYLHAVHVDLATDNVNY